LPAGGAAGITIGILFGLAAIVGGVIGGILLIMYRPWAEDSKLKSPRWRSTSSTLQHSATWQAVL